MTAPSISIGLIGLGDMGRGHLACLKDFAEVRIAALCDHDPARLDAAQHLLGRPVATYQRYADLLAHADVDVVFVSVPNFLHAEIGLAVLHSGKHLFLEKPLADTVAHGEQLLAAARQSRGVTFVGHIYRFSPFYQAMMEWIEQGVIGRPVLLWCHEFRQPFPQRNWFYDHTKSGGTFVEKNCHHADLFNWITRDRATSVVAVGGRAVLHPGTEIACSYCPDPPMTLQHNTTIDHGWMVVEYRGGAKANLGLCMFLRPPDEVWRGLELGIIGDTGKPLISNVDQGVMTVYGGTQKEATRTIVNPFQGQWHSGMREEHEAFLAAIRSGTHTMSPTVPWAYEALRICAAAETSMTTHRAIKL